MSDTTVSSVSRCISYLRLLPYFGSEVQAVLPSNLACPRCRQLACYVYADSILGGEWLHCRHCGLAGDMVDIAAQLWNLEIPATLLRLTKEQLWSIEPGEELSAWHLEHVVGTRRATGEFWQDCQTRLWSQPDPILRALSLDLGVQSSQIWQTRTRELVGQCQTQVFHQWLQQHGEQLLNRLGSRKTRTGGF